MGSLSVNYLSLNVNALLRRIMTKRCVKPVPGSCCVAGTGHRLYVYERRAGRASQQPGTLESGKLTREGNHVPRSIYLNQPEG